MSKSGVAAMALALCSLVSPSLAGGPSAGDTVSVIPSGEGVVVVLRSATPPRARSRISVEVTTRLGTAPDEGAFTRRLLHPEVTATSLEPVAGVEGSLRATQVGVRD